MLETMAKLHIIGHQSKLDETLAVLHGLRTVHLIDVSDDGTVPLPPLAVDEQHLQRMEDLRYLRARLGSVLALIPNLPEPGPSVPEMTESSLDRMRGELNELAPRVEQIVHHIDDLTREQETLPRHVASLTKLLPLVPGLAQLHGYGTAVLLVESRHSSVLGELNVQLTDKLAGNFEIISDHVDSNTVGAVLVYPRDHSEEVASLLGREAISRVRLPRQYETMSFREAISAMKTRLADLPGEIASSQRELDVLVAAHADWAAAASYLEQHLDQEGHRRESRCRRWRSAAGSHAQSGTGPAVRILGAAACDTALRQRRPNAPDGPFRSAVLRDHARRCDLRCNPARAGSGG